MRRFFSIITALLLIYAGAVRFCDRLSIAAQELQQQQNSDTVPVKTPSPIQGDKPVTLQIPDGTVIDIEAPYRLNSMEFKPNDKISFRVVNPIKLNGVTVIEAGAIATGRIDRAKRGGHFGKAGVFVWTMQTVTAVDGSQVPLRAVPVRVRGDSKAAKVATQMIITGALLPLIAPVALLHGFKRARTPLSPQANAIRCMSREILL